MSVACIVIASAKRADLLDQYILPSILDQWFSEVVVIGDYHSGEGYRHLPFSPVTGTTVDAQFKRDIATAATKSDWLLYLCDDHRLAPHFSRDLTEILAEHGEPQDIIVPARFCRRDGERKALNMGWPGHLGKPYVGGHAGVFHRELIREVPWSVAPWHPNWDYLHSQILVERGARLHFQNERLFIEDVEGGTPWL